MTFTDLVIKELTEIHGLSEEEAKEIFGKIVDENDFMAGKWLKIALTGIQSLR